MQDFFFHQLGTRVPKLDTCAKGGEGLSTIAWYPGWFPEAGVVISWFSGNDAPQRDSLSHNNELRIITARVRGTREGNVLTPVCVSVHTFGGGPRSQVFWGGPRSQIFRGGPRSQIFRVGGPRSHIFGGGPRSHIFRGGIPGLSKGKNFWHQIWLDTCSDWEKNFCRGTPLPLQ